MDDQNKSLNERWAPGAEPRERGYATDPGFASTSESASREYDVDRRGYDTSVPDEASAERTAHIRRDIDRTRADMSETLDAIQDRLRPSSVVSRAAQQAKDAAGEKVRQLGHAFQGNRTDGPSFTSNAMIDRIRENPVPAAIAAASLAWLAFGSRSPRRPDYRPGLYGTTNGEPFVRETRIDVNASFDDHAQRDWSTQAQQTMTRTTSQLRDTAQDVRYRSRQFASQSPLATGAIAALAGLAIGLMIPETERENELMGDARDSLMERGRETVKDTAAQVQRVASDVTDAAKRIVGDATGTDVLGADNP